MVPLGEFKHDCEGQLICRSINEKIPYFNGFVYLENKTKIGKVDEIFGPTAEVWFSVKTDEGVVASSFKTDDKVYISPDKLLPMSRFTGQGKKGGGGRGGRGGRGRSSWRGR